MPDSSQGTTVSFGGTNIGSLTGYDIAADSGQVSEITSVYSTQLGTGTNSRVVKEYDCTSIEPLSLNITFYGAGGFSDGDRGMKAQLVFDSPSAEISGEAILVGFSHSGRVGEFSTGSATFRLTGT